MLDSHPDLAIPGESGFILDVCSPKVPPGSPDELVDSFCTRLESFDRYRRWNLDPDQIRRCLKAARPLDCAEAMRITFAQYAAGQGKSRYGDKTPDHVLQIRKLAALFPEAKFVHVIRDGRDVALSTLAVDWGPESMPAAARYWRHRVAGGRRAGAALGSARYLEIRYEDLIAEPASVLHQVTDFIDLPFASSMLRSDDAIQRQITMSPDPAADRSLLLPLTKGLRNWRRDMSAQDLATFEVIAGRLLEKLGYERAASVRPPMWMRIQAERAIDAMHSIRSRLI